MIDALAILGGLGAALLAFSGVPQLISSWRAGHARGLSAGLLVSWWLGEGCMCIYAAALYSDPWLLLNYGGNFVLVSGLVFLKIAPRE